jgi:hypothetical protein
MKMRPRSRLDRLFTNPQPPSRHLPRPSSNYRRISVPCIVVYQVMSLCLTTGLRRNQPRGLYLAMELRLATVLHDLLLSLAMELLLATVLHDLLLSLCLATELRLVTALRDLLLFLSIHLAMELRLPTALHDLLLHLPYPLNHRRHPPWFVTCVRRHTNTRMKRVSRNTRRMHMALEVV